MRRAGLVIVMLGLAACGGSSSSQGQDSGPPPDTAAGDTAPGDALAPADRSQQDGGPDQDGAPPDDAGSDGGPTDGGVPDGATYRNSLGVCWTDAACQRVMAIGHGGAWDAVSRPYDSNAAISYAYDIGMEGVKIDVRVSSDDVPVVAHSSPIEIYESLLCSGWKIEEKTAAQITGCLRFPSMSEKFQRVDEVLSYLRGKMVVQLCVKRSQDYQRTIDLIHALGAEDFAFIEVDSAAQMQTLIPTLTGAGTVWYLVNLGSNLADVDLLIDVVQNPRAFMYEFDPGIDVSTLTPSRLHPAGIRSFTYDSAAAPSVNLLQGHYESGYDVVSAQNGPNNVQARTNVNTARGISPP